MAKDPAFLFYSNDFLTGTMTLTFEDRGKYITLLCLMHQQGRLNEESVKFIVGDISNNLMSKFSRDVDGNWFNKRLEEETDRRNKFTESRRNNAKKKVNTETSNTISNSNSNNKIDALEKHMLQHMENENVNTNNTIAVYKNSNEIKDSNSWGKEKKYFLNEEQYFYKISTCYKITKNDVTSFANVFLNELELAEDYKDLKELKRHFSYWLKKRKDEKERKATFQQPDPTKVKIKLSSSPTPKYD